MARRTKPPDEMLTRQDLAELQQRLSMMCVTAVGDFYQSAHLVCRIGPGPFSERESNSGTRAGVEANAGVALITGG